MFVSVCDAVFTIRSYVCEQRNFDQTQHIEHEYIFLHTYLLANSAVQTQPSKELHSQSVRTTYMVYKKKTCRGESNRTSNVK